MNIASKVNLLIAALAVLAAILLTLFVGQRDFSYQRDGVILEASSFVGSKPNLQLTFYFRDAQEVRSTLEGLLGLSPAIKYAVLYDNQGGIIGELKKDWAQNASMPAFKALRNNLPPLENGLHTVSGDLVPAELSLLKTLTLGEKNTSLTLPVVSVVNPAVSNLGREDFAAALAYPELVGSFHVIGYVEVAFSSTVLWSQTLPTVALSASVGFAIVFLFWLIARITTRRITAPLGMLASVADDIAAGRQTETLRITGSGEVRDIANVFNGIIEGLHRSKKQMATDKKILSMKVDEKTEQLTQSKQELGRAEQNVSEAKDRIRHLAYFDSLTSLPNRRLFTEQLTLLLRLALRANQNVGLLLVDIDHFKRINDSLGAASGDRLLQEIGERLASGVRDSDVLHRRQDADGGVMDLSRMGGDEFTVVLNQLDSEASAQRIAKRLAENIAKPFIIDRQEVVITCSIGIALAPEHADGVEGLLQAADTAMINAKKQGRNRILTYNDSMEGANKDRLQLETDLRKAIEREQLLLHFQPQVNGRTGVVSGVETLVRWNHPDQGLVPPFKWIPIAEELGLMDEVGTWVLRKACQEMVKLTAADLGLPKIAVNVSALQLHPDFVGTVSKILRETGLKAGLLELELTEGIMINDQEATIELVQQLKALGVRLSIDDFGTGYSSLSYLTRFPLNELKIDRSFVLGLRDGHQNAELVRAIIAMAKSLELEIVVEGVETVDELQFFRDQDVNTIQGFLFSTPVPIEKLRDLLAPNYFAAQLKVLDRKLESSIIELEQA